MESKCYYFSLFAYLFFQEIDGVRLATSKTEKGFVQIVLTDEENGIEALTKTVRPLLPLVLDVNHCMIETVCLFVGIPSMCYVQSSIICMRTEQGGFN